MPQNFAQLAQDGSFDLSFQLGAGLTDPSLDFLGIAPLNTGEVLAWRNDVDPSSGATLTYFYRMEEDGTLGMSYSASEYYASDILPQRDGSVLIAAGTYVDEEVNQPLYRIGAEGTEDSGFGFPASISQSQGIHGCGANPDIYVGLFPLATTPDGKIILSYFASDSLWHVVRLLPNRSLDNTFQPATTPALQVTSEDLEYGCGNGPDETTTHTPGALLNIGAILPDGSVVIGGTFTSFDGTPANGLVHLLANGTIDPGFDAGSGPQLTATSAPATIDSIYPVPNGNLLVVGNFNHFNGSSAPGIVMLHRDGSVDTTFAPPVERIYARAATAQLIAQNDGSVLLTGPYSFIGQNFERSLVRLTFDKLPIITSVVSRKTHGQAGTYDINLPLSGALGVESRSGGPGGIHQIVITLTNDVVSGNVAVSSGSGSVAGAQFSGNTMVINLTGVADAQRISLALTNVTNTSSQTLPDTTLPIAFLLGDTNGDGAVNSADATFVRNHSGQTSDSTNFRADSNADGAINSADATIVRSHSGNSLGGNISPSIKPHLQGVGTVGASAEGSNR